MRSERLLSRFIDRFGSLWVPSDSMKSIFVRLSVIYGSLVALEWFFVERLDTFGIGELKNFGWVGYFTFFLLPIFPAAGYLAYRHYRPPLHLVRICQFHRCLAYSVLYIADARGFFRRRGLKVELTDGLGDRQVWTSVKNGNADFGVADPTVMLENPESPAKVISSLVAKMSLDGLSRGRLPPVEEVRHLAGLRLAVYESPSTAFMLAKWFQRQLAATGAEPPTIVEMKPGTEHSVLESSTVDVVLLPEPIATACEDLGAHRVFSGAKLFGNCLVTGLFATDRYLQENPVTAQSVVDAVEEGLAFIHNHPMRAAEIVAGFFPDSKNRAIERAWLRMFAEGVVPRRTTVLESAWSRCLELRMGLTSTRFVFNQHVAPSFAHRAVESFGNP